MQLACTSATPALHNQVEGLLEARTRSGELFGFRRLSKLVESRPNAEQMTAVAQEFGQEDDITVVTITRLAVAAESTTQLVRRSCATSRGCVLKLRIKLRTKLRTRNECPVLTWLGWGGVVDVSRVEIESTAVRVKRCYGLFWAFCDGLGLR